MYYGFSIHEHFFCILDHDYSRRSTWQKGENNKICDEGFGGTQSIVMMQCVFHCLICLRIFCIMQSMSLALFMPIMRVCPNHSLIRCYLIKHTHQGVMFGGRVHLDSYVQCLGSTTNKFWVFLLMHPPCTSPQQRGLFTHGATYIETRLPLGIACHIIYMHRGYTT